MSDVVHVELDSANRILIPAEIQQRLGLSPGMTLLVEADKGGGVALTIQSEEVPTLINEGGVLVANVAAVEDLAGFVREERALRALDITERDV
jgi:AbrB family looped-hinge helix DNA binding protein